MKFKRGDINSDGLIFWRYCSGREVWLTKEKFEDRRLKKNKINLKSHHKNKEARYKNHIDYISKIKGTDKGEQRRLSINIRNRTRKFLKNSVSYGTIGCDWTFYKKYLESFMTSDMNWDNYGSYWHIDHTVPLSKFDLSDESELRSAVHYTNTRPMLAKENLSKSDKIDESNSQIKLGI